MYALVRCFAWRSWRAALKPVPRPLKCVEFRFWCSPTCLLLEPIFGGTRAFSTGDFEIVVEESERRDEIGSIARSLFEFRDRMKRADELRRTEDEGGAAQTLVAQATERTAFIQSQNG
jgi:hypothetical protein